MQKTPWDEKFIPTKNKKINFWQKLAVTPQIQKLFTLNPQLKPYLY